MWPPEAQVWTIQKVKDKYVNDEHIYCHFNICLHKYLIMITLFM